jgi:hypothetical protein
MAGDVSDKFAVGRKRKWISEAGHGMESETQRFLEIHKYLNTTYLNTLHLNVPQHRRPQMSWPSPPLSQSHQSL